MVSIDMAKVECKELAGQPCTFAYVGTLQFDENGIVEIDHEGLLADLAKVRGFRVLPEEPAPKTVDKKIKKEEPKTENKSE